MYIDAAVAGVLQTVPDEMKENPLQLGRIGAQRRGNIRVHVKHQLEIGRDGGTDVHGQIVEKGREHVNVGVERERPHFDFGKVQNILHLILDPHTGGVNFGQSGLDFLILDFLLRDGGGTQNHIDRCAQLMGEIRQENIHQL